jgi:hypothetical protein
LINEIKYGIDDGKAMDVSVNRWCKVLPCNVPKAYHIILSRLHARISNIIIILTRKVLGNTYECQFAVLNSLYNHPQQITKEQRTVWTALG